MVLVVVVVGYGFAIGGGSAAAAATDSIVTGQPSGVTAKVVRKGDTGSLHLAAVQQAAERPRARGLGRRGGEVEPVRALFVPDRRVTPRRRSAT